MRDYKRQEHKRRIKAFLVDFIRPSCCDVTRRSLPSAPLLPAVDEKKQTVSIQFHAAHDITPAPQCTDSSTAVDGQFGLCVLQLQSFMPVKSPVRR